MLRIYCLQQWFNLSDPAAEETLHDSLAMRRFVGIDLGRERAPDETTICRFRHLLEEHKFGRAMFQLIHDHLEAKGVRLSTGTIVDATIIDAPSSTKNAEKARDPDMRQTKKGNQWYFGMKAHFRMQFEACFGFLGDISSACLEARRTRKSGCSQSRLKSAGIFSYRHQRLRKF
jgi:IS5 family transposase